MMRRPSGTDGSDFSYRMVVDSRYRKVVEYKYWLSILINAQIIVNLLATATIILLNKTEHFDRILVSVPTTCIIYLFGRELAQGQPRVNILKFFLLGSSIGYVIYVVTLSTSNYMLRVFRDFSILGTSVCELMNIAVGLLGLVLQISVIATTVALLRNMTPPKRNA